MSDAKKRTLAGVLGLMLVGVMAVPAAAEGSFSSRFSGWLPGKDSRTWTGNWGRQSSGSYHFTLTQVNGSEYSSVGKVKASAVKVSY